MLMGTSDGGSFAKAVAEHSGMQEVWVNGPDYCGVEGLQALKKKLQLVVESSPAVLVIDQLDALCPPLLRASGSGGEGQDFAGTAEASLCREFVAFLDDMRRVPLFPRDGGEQRAKPVLLILATACGMDHESETVDEQILRTGRMDDIVKLKTPTAKEREKVLCCLLTGIPYTTEAIAAAAEKSHGFCGSDLKQLCRSAVEIVAQRSGGDEEEPIASADMEEALRVVVPAVLYASNRLQSGEGALSFEDFGGVADTVNLLRASVVDALKCERDDNDALQVPQATGMLFFGPTGTGKTTMAHALAKESGLNMVSIRGPEILSPLVGQSEKNLHDVFCRAKAAAPCMLFMDQAGTLMAPRGSPDASKSQDRLLGALLTELDGVQDDKSAPILVIAAVTLDTREGSASDALRRVVDPALLRGGRFGDHVYFGRPRSAEEQTQVLACALAPRFPDLSSLERRQEATAVVTALGDLLPTDCSQAELQSLSREAAMASLREDIANESVEDRHWRLAAATVWGKALPPRARGTA